METFSKCKEQGHVKSFQADFTMGFTDSWLKDSINFQKINYGNLT